MPPRSLLANGLWLASVFVIALTGCGRKSAGGGDAQVLESLAAYTPKPVLNDQGRVVELKLEGAQVDDRALDNLKSLSELKLLSLYGSSVTDEGLVKLSELARLESLGLGKTKVTRRGLAHIERLPALRWLWVTDSQAISGEQVDDFKKKAVPGIVVYR